MNFDLAYRKNYQLVNGILFAFALMVLVLNNRGQFCYDSRQYWELAKQYGSAGHFDFLNFNDSLRGYLLPLLLYPAVKLGELFSYEVLICRFYLIGIFALFYTFGIALLFKVFFKSVLSPFLHALLGVILVVLWWEAFTLPLTDIAGVIFLFLSFALLPKQNQWLHLLSGACLYATLNLRLINIIAIPFFVFYIVLVIQAWKPKIKALAFTFIGFILLATPQWVINRAHFSTNSILVQSDKSKFTEGKSLYLMQLSSGIRFQKYETNIGTTYPKPGIFYMDEWAKEMGVGMPEKGFEGYGQYLHFVFGHPPVLFTYLKHLFNGLDITTPRIFLTSDIYYRSSGLKFFNYSVLFLGVLGMILNFRKLSILTQTVTLLSLTLALLVVPTLVEVRFFIPLHFFFYFYALFLLQNSTLRLLKSNKKRLYILSLIYICFVSLCFYASSNTMKQIEFKSTAANISESVSSIL
ncbi:MAG: hypothetical protein NTW54_02140 [Bacteroidetes bacterium]|nr:hypothetical protein [Bacteroidota bacterium]